MLDLSSVKAKKSWDEVLQALVLVRLGQELGSNSALAGSVAAAVDAVLELVKQLTP